MSNEIVRQDESRILQANSGKDISDKVLNDFIKNQKHHDGVNNATSKPEPALAGAAALDQARDLAKSACQTLGFGNCEIFDPAQDKVKPKIGIDLEDKKFSVPLNGSIETMKDKFQDLYKNKQQNSESPLSWDDFRKGSKVGLLGRWK